MMRRSLLVLLILGSSFCAAFAQTPGIHLGGRSFADLFAAQRSLLSNYCRLDFEGARLTENGWAKMKPFTTLKSNPEFTRVLVVTRFDIDPQPDPSALLRVSYQGVGVYDPVEGYTPNTGSWRSNFRVQEQNGDLMIAEITPAEPHVSPRAALAWMKMRLADPKTSEIEQAHLKDAVAQLERLVQPRPAAQ